MGSNNTFSLLLIVVISMTSCGDGLNKTNNVKDEALTLKEKFGEDIIIKKFEKSKGWLSKKLSSSNDHIDYIANILDEKSVWQKYGL